MPTTCRGRPNTLFDTVLGRPLTNSESCTGPRCRDIRLQDQAAGEDCLRNVKSAMRIGRFVFSVYSGCNPPEERKNAAHCENYRKARS